ncbi:MAG: hypothetical protein QG566_64 [Patescibacteria group bacterium]|nr:hypothetical protein [Patescibacteria group bacterium]
MTRGQYKEKFGTCTHKWTLHMDADSANRDSNSLFICDNCRTIVTMLERNSLDSLRFQEKAMEESLISQKESQKIQEKSISISAWIATISIIVAVIVFLFGDGILK